MRSLPEIQRAFAADLLDRSAERSWGMRAYRSNVFGNWAGALAGAYPIVRKIVGAEFFDAMAREYARAHPSVSGDLNEYGARLPGFVAGFEHTRDLPYLPDVARMEWLAHLAYYAADAKPPDFSVLGATPPGAHSLLRIELGPCCAMLRSDWPLARLWEVHQDDYRGAVQVDFAPGPYHILVLRRCWKAEVHAVALGEYRFLAGAEHGGTLGELIDAALEVDPVFDPAAALRRWIEAGALCL